MVKLLSFKIHKITFAETQVNQFEAKESADSKYRVHAME